MEENIQSSKDEENSSENRLPKKSSLHICCNQNCNQTENVTLKAPDFVLNFFNITSKNIHYVCNDCFEMALRLQEHLVWSFQNDNTLTSIDTPDYTEVNDLTNDKENIEELDETLAPETVRTINDHLQEIAESFFSKLNLEVHMQQEQEILNQRLIYLENESVSLNTQLSNMQKKLDTLQENARNLNPCVQVNLPPEDLSECGNDKSSQVPETSRKRTFASDVGHSLDAPIVVDKILNNNNQSNLPPTGTFQRPILKKGDIVYTMKLPVFGNWVKSLIMEIYQKGSQLPTQVIASTTMYKVKIENSGKKNYKLVSGKEIAYSKPSPVRLSYGVRVIALFKDLDLEKNFYYSGTTAEPPKIMNSYRYLVFFDDGYAQYVTHENILPIVEPSPLVWEDTHPDSREFIKKYLEQYPERPMVKLQKSQVIKTEWNGKWWIARVVEVDCSLAKMLFDADSRTEWIYRGSTRLGPLYAELNHVASRLDQTRTFPRHRGYGLRKQNMPYIEYTRGDDSRLNDSPVIEEYRTSETSRAVAKKSVTKNKTPIPSKYVNPNTRAIDPGKIKIIELDKTHRPKIFKNHSCSFECIKHVNIDPKTLRGINPLSFPLNSGFDRLICKFKGRRIVMYRAPCGRILRNLKEMHYYLRLVESKLSVDYFDFDHWVNCTEEFYVEHCLFETPDLSYGSENVPVQCVNVIDHNYPEYLYYSTQRRPTKGVNLNLDDNFLVGCDCTDDCQDKLKCRCWQLTIQGANYMKEDNSDVHVGYHYRRLAEPVLTGIYECNSRCKCSNTCLNRVAQQPLQMKLQVFKTQSKGWGIRCLNDIPQGAFICIYAGKLLTEEEANKVNISGQDFGDEYLAELDYIEVVERLKEGYESDVEEANEKRLRSANKTITKRRKPKEPRRSTREYFGTDEYCFIMDAKTHGNIGRYLNHSCSPNIFVQNVFVDTHDLRFPWVAFFASYYIKAGSELTWDYNYDIGSVPGKVLYCHCGSTECRGRLL